MIKHDHFNDTREYSSGETYGFEEIKPRSEMSESEMMSFVSEEFHSLSELDCEDDDLIQFCDWSEDQIDIDYQVTDDLKASIDKFSLDEWDKLSYPERVNLIKEVANKIASSLGISDIPKIEILDYYEDSYGYYDRSNNTITLNKCFINDGKEVLNTLAHEIRHAYQYVRAEKMETTEDVLYKMNLDNYIVPVQLPNGDWILFDDYYNQYVEVDARAFADIISGEI